MLLFGFIIDIKLEYIKESLGGKRRYCSIDSYIYYRVKIL
jgi:hypothetical protein